MEAHDSIEKETKEIIKRINQISHNNTSEAMESIYIIAQEWYQNYGKYYETLKEADQLSRAKSVLNPANKCKKCKSSIEKFLSGTGPHKYKVVCDNGHFKGWK